MIDQKSLLKMEKGDLVNFFAKVNRAYKPDTWTAGDGTETPVHDFVVNLPAGGTAKVRWWRYDYVVEAGDDVHIQGEIYGEYKGVPSVTAKKVAREGTAPEPAAAPDSPAPVKAEPPRKQAAGITTARELVTLLVTLQKLIARELGLEFSDPAVTSLSCTAAIQVMRSNLDPALDDNGDIPF